MRIAGAAPPDVALGIGRFGADLSESACLQASANAVQHQVQGRIEILCSNWFENIDGEFDLIVSNPPYISLDEMAELSPEVREYEPRMALTDEGDGLGAYRRIAASAPDFLMPGGRLLVEIGPTQGKSVSALFDAAGLIETRIIPDLDGRDRVIVARMPQ